nr:MAG: wsv325-like protein [Penaeus semisulcatus pemonivirus]
METKLPDLHTIVLIFFFIMNVLQFLIIVIGMVYSISSVWRVYTQRKENKGGPRLISPIGGGRRSRLLFARGLTKRLVMKFQTCLTPKRVGHALVKPGLDALAKDREMFSKFADKSTTNTRKSVRGESEEAGQSLVNMLSSKLKQASDNRYRKKDNVLKWGQDPLVYFSAVTSKFVSEYTPLHAHRAWTIGQITGQLIMPHPITSGSAFVLPTGHIINKSFGMTKEDIMAYNPPDPEIDEDIQPSCTVAPKVTRTNLYGYAGSKKNLSAYEKNTTETLLCTCNNHKNLLEEPDVSTYASNPMAIEIYLDKKQALLPGPGIAPITSIQPTTISAGDQDHHETAIGRRRDSQNHDLEIVENNSIVAPTVPVYGAGLINLPVSKLPIAVNCICTDRPDGIYRVSRPPINSNIIPVAASQTDGALEEMTANNPIADKQGGFILYRHLASYLNANPIKAINLHSQYGGFWAIDGGPISTVTCKDEQVVCLN